MITFFSLISSKVSVFDSVVQGGDAVWEGLQIYNGKVFKLEEHLDRSVMSMFSYYLELFIILYTYFKSTTLNMLVSWSMDLYWHPLNK